MSKPPAAPIHPLVLMQVEARLTEEQKAIQNVVRDFAAKELKPNIAGWYEDGQLPARDLAKALGGIQQQVHLQESICLFIQPVRRCHRGRFLNVLRWRLIHSMKWKISCPNTYVAALAIPPCTRD